MGELKKPTLVFAQLLFSFEALEKHLQKGNCYLVPGKNRCDKCQLLYNYSDRQDCPKTGLSFAIRSIIMLTERDMQIPTNIFIFRTEFMQLTFMW